jgi:hypothetical protein
VTVEAEDHTWAIGRHTELLERLTEAQPWYGPRKANSPTRSSKPVADMKPHHLLIRSLRRTFEVTIAVVVGFLAIVLAIGLTAQLLIGPAYQIGNAIFHSHSISHTELAKLPASLLVLLFIVGIASIEIAGRQSKVIIRRKPLLSPTRIAAVTATTAIVVAVTTVLALFK